MSRRDRVVVFQWDIDRAMEGAEEKMRALFPTLESLSMTEEKPATHRSPDGWVAIGQIHGTLPNGSAISYLVQWNGWTGDRRLTRLNGNG